VSTPVSEKMHARTNVQMVAYAVAVTFGLVGVLGFIPGVTTDFDSMEFAGHHSGAQLFGVFDVSVLHNLVHLLFAVAGLALARRAQDAKAYLIGGGVVYLVLTVYGAVVDRHSGANFVPLDHADNWLHLGLGVGMIALGLIVGRHSRAGGDEIRR
jgi:hypothetical protein